MGETAPDQPEVFRSGFVALIGRPNVGKSTLVNQLVGDKVAITSPVAQTTRNRLRAILTTETAQLILVDTPGIHKPHHLLGERLVQSARAAIGEVDQVLLPQLVSVPLEQFKLSPSQVVEVVTHRHLLLLSLVLEQLQQPIISLILLSRHSILHNTSLMMTECSIHS